MTTRVLILGAGFGGLELTARLSAELGDRVDITLIDRSDSFMFGFAKLDVMFGRRTAPGRAPAVLGHRQAERAIPPGVDHGDRPADPDGHD